MIYCICNKEIKYLLQNGINRKGFNLWIIQRVCKIFGGLFRKDFMKRLKLKRKGLIIITVCITLLSGLFIQIVYNRITWINKKASECDIEHGYTCSLNDLQNYLRNN